MILGYECSMTTLAPATLIPYVVFRPGRTSFIRQIEIYNSSPSTPLPLLQLAHLDTSPGSVATATVTPTAAANSQFVAPSLAAAPTAVFETAWSTPPVINTSGPVLRTLDVAGTVGSFVVWTWPQDGELICVASIQRGWIGLFNGSPGTTAIIRVTFVWGE